MNDPAPRLPQFPSLSDYLFQHAGRIPACDLAIFGDERLSYAQAAEKVRAISRYLVASGVKPGDRVATLCTSRPEFLLTYLATIDIGAIWVGLNPKYRIAELTHVVEDSSPRVLFALTRSGDRDYRQELTALGRTPSLERLITIGPEMPGADSFEQIVSEGEAGDDFGRLAAREAVEGDAPALIVYTSGSTGAPKGAVITHHGLVWCFTHQWRRWRVNPLRMVCNLPINHIGAAGDVLCTPLVGGGAIVFMERFDPAGVLEAVERERVNALFQIPTMLQMITATPEFEAADLSSLELITWGGAPMPRATLRLLRERTDARLEAMYGQTESTGTVFHTDDEATDEQLAETIGRPDPAIETRLRDAEGLPVEPGAEGEIQVRHHSVFVGYHGRQEATERAFTEDGFLRTGDLAVERPDGNYRIVGRLTDMFKSGGYNVYPREVELCLERHPAVAMAAVVGVPDPVFSEVGHGFVVLRPGSAAGEDELRGWCREHLANYKVPKAIEIIDEFPRLPIGKIDKRALRSSVEPVGAARKTGDARHSDKGERNAE